LPGEITSDPLQGQNVPIFCGRVILRRSYRTGGFIPKSDIDRGIKTWVLLKYRLTIVTTNVVTSNPAHGKVYSIQHYVITFVRDLWYVSGFLLASFTKTDHHDITKRWDKTPYPFHHGLTNDIHYDFM
jgi:hypothetical protein